MNLNIYRPGNRLVTGSTRSGKSTAHLIDIVLAAMAMMTVVVLDPHGTLAKAAFDHLVARGCTRRLLYDQLAEFDRVLGYGLLRPSTASHPFRREAENEQSAKEFLDVILRRRDLVSLASFHQTEEDVTDAITLLLNQDREPPTDQAIACFDPLSADLPDLIAHCTHRLTREKFQAIADGQIKPGQYAAARRLFKSVFSSPVFTLRLQRSFDLYDFLDHRGILLVAGGPGISPDAANMTMAMIGMQVINYARTRHRTVPRILLVLEEATNASLVGAAGHEVRAMAELQKKGLDIHVLVQSPTFPNSYIEDAILTNTIEHVWMYAANPAVAQKAARDLGNTEYAEMVRRLRQGERYIRRLTEVTFNRVTPLPDPWTIPGLTARKSKQALRQILQRTEYRSPSCSEPKSSNLPSDTSSSPATSSITSPAERLATGRSGKCTGKGNSESSDESS